MSQHADPGTLARMANEILVGKEFFVTAILDRLNNASDAVPHDQAIKTAQFVLEKRLQREGTLATMAQGDFQTLYEEVSGLGNKEAFRHFMDDFLLAEAAPAPARYNEEFITGRRDTDDVINIANPDMVQEFSGMFDSSPHVTAGSFIDNGRKGLELELEALGVASPNVEVAASNDKFVIYATEVTSSHGRVPALIPAEIKLGSVLMPSVFVSGVDFIDLNSDNLQSHAQSVSMGDTQHIPAPIVLEALTASFCDDNVTKTASYNEEFNIEQNLSNTNVYDKDFKFATSEELKGPEPKLPRPLEHLTEGSMRDILIEAGLSIDDSLVVEAKGLIESELRGMGIRADKITVASEFDGGIMIAANIVGKGGKSTIEIPVEIVSGRVLMPSVFTSGVQAKTFNQANLLAMANGEDKGVFRTAFSNKLGWSYSELYGHALKNATYGNFVETEEAMAIIAEQFGPEFHRSAFNDLTTLLSVSASSAEDSSVDVYMERALAQARDKESNIKMSGSLMYLYPDEVN